MNREIMQQALNALIHHRQQTRPIDLTDATIKALEAELAKPEQEPVAWMLPEYGDVLSASEADGTGIYNIPLYTAPPRKEWVGLTDEDTANICMQSDFNNWHDEQVIDAVEAKLKEKNGGEN